MQVSQSRTLQAYERVVSFLDANTALLGTIPQSAPRKTLDGVITALTANASTQGSTNVTKQGVTNQTYALRKTLVSTHMRPIATIVKDKLSAIPQLPPFAMPAERVSVGVLVAAAHAMAEAAMPYAQTFIDDGLPADFIAQLDAAATALNAAVLVQGTTKAKQVSATTAVLTQVQQGRRSLNIIDTVVKAALAGNAPMLSQWANIKRISPKPASTSPAASTPTTTTPGAATTTLTPGATTAAAGAATAVATAETAATHTTAAATPAASVSATTEASETPAEKTTA